MSTTSYQERGQQARPVCFQHIRTGRTLSAPSIAAFARKAKLGPTAQYHFDSVLKGRRLHHKGWGLPARLNAQLDLQDVFGNEEAITVGELAAKSTVQRANRLAAGDTFRSVAPAGHDYGPILKPKGYRVNGYVLRKSRWLYDGMDRHGRAKWRLSKGRLVHGRTLKEVSKVAGICLMGAFELVHGYADVIKGVTLAATHTTKRSAFGALMTKPGRRVTR